MAAQGSTPAPEVNGQNSGSQKSRSSGRPGVVAKWFAAWKQSFVAELLNLLERRRYDSLK